MTTAQQAEQAGFDLSLVEASLRLTPEQRLHQHQSALDCVLMAERAGRQMRERAQPPAAWLEHRHVGPLLP